MDSATRYSIDKTGRELLFLPLSKQSKEQSKLFIDIFVDRFSRGIGGLLLLGFIIAFDAPVYLLTYAVIIVLGLWIYLGIRAQKGYVEKFRNSVQKQLVSTESIALNLNEPSTYAIIRDSLQCSNDSQILHTLFLLDEFKIEKIIDELRSLLSHDNREIRLQSLKLLQQADDINLSEEVKQLLSDDDPEIRLETIYYLCKHSSEDPQSVLKSYLVRNDYKLRSAALGCASKHDGSATELVDHDFFEDLLNNDSKDAIVIKSQIADALGHINDDELSRKYLTTLLNEKHPTVVRKAIASMGRQKNDRFIPLLIKKLGDVDFKLDARKTLASYGTDYLILYKERFFDDDVPKNIRKALPGVFSHRPEQTSVDHLINMIDIHDTDLRYHVIKTLNKLIRERPSFTIDKTQIRNIIDHEIHNYHELLAIKLIQPQNHPNQILLKALEEKMNQAIERVFRLLGLIYNPSDMYGTYLALQSISSDKRSAAVEFLDNLLSDSDKKYILPITDERTDQERLAAGRELFTIPEMGYDDGLLQLIEGEDHWLHVCAIYSVSPQCPQSLQSKVEEATYASDELLRETAVKVMKRNRLKTN